MRKTFSLLSLCLFLMQVSAQQLYFPKDAVTDSVVLEKVMPELAKKVIAAYHLKDDRKTYLDHLFRLQMVAGEYEQANVSIQELRMIDKKDAMPFAELSDIQYQLFADAKLKQAGGQQSFYNAFKQGFREVHSKLNDKAAVYISGSFFSGIGVPGLQIELHAALKKQTEKDSIDINDAVALCEDYNTLQLYRAIQPLTRQLMTEDNRNRYVTQDSILIKTRDGTYISAIVVHKKGVTTPQPTVLQFTIYTGAVSDITRDAVAHGYIGMIAFSRGKRFTPEKQIAPYEHDGADCYDVIDWISKQKWSNGKVGMYGGSYTGFTQWAAAKHLHPALKTIVPSASAAPGLDVPMMNNVFENFVFPWIYYVSNNKFLDFADYNNNAQWDALDAKWYATGKPHRVLDSLTGRGTNKIFQSWIAHPSYDKYWQNMIPYREDFAKINIPVLATTGYYDGGQVGAMYYFREHYKYNKKADQYLIIGPYSHIGSQGFVGSPPDLNLGGYQIDKAANIPIHEIIFQWFDYVLKGGKKPAILKDRVNYEVMGHNEWRHAHSLDKMANDTLKFYLDNHSLNMKKPVTKSFLKEKVDFADRKTSNTFYHADTIINNKLDSSNGFSFVSDPVKKPMSINGCFLGEIRAAINKKDFDYNINLYELMPDGKYFYLSYFMGRASYAHDPSKRQLLKPGQVESLPFTNSYMTSRQISAGSRIVIVISVNKSQDNQINYGTGKNVRDESIVDAKIPLEVKWYNDSYIKIPVWK